MYHLDTQEVLEQIDYPKDPELFKKYGTRGVLHTWATDVDDPTVDPRFGQVGKQKIEDSGQRGRERMKTMDAKTRASPMLIAKPEQLLRAFSSPAILQLATGSLQNWTHPRRLRIRLRSCMQKI